MEEELSLECTPAVGADEAIRVILEIHSRDFFPRFRMINEGPE